VYYSIECERFEADICQFYVWSINLSVNKPKLNRFPIPFQFPSHWWLIQIISVAYQYIATIQNLWENSRSVA
jgi:hypothetical protein